MTNRNRRSQTRTNRRSGRLVWANQSISLGLSFNTLAIQDVLTPAADFMLFDTTIMRIVAPTLALTFTSEVTRRVRSVRWAFLVANENIDAVDLQGLFATTTGSPWLGVGGLTAVNSAVADITMSLSAQDNIIDLKAKRRFRENSATLWLLLETAGFGGADANLLVTGFVRTLIRIP